VRLEPELPEETGRLRLWCRFWQVHPHRLTCVSLTSATRPSCALVVLAERHYREPVSQDDDGLIHGEHYYADPPPDGAPPWAPRTNHDQACAFCGAARPAFAHRLDPAHVRYRMYGQGYTLPTFWATCSRCEDAVAGDDYAAVIALMTDRWGADEVGSHASLQAFRRADLGPEALPEGPTDTIRP
jgi:hypothetical protein